MLRKDLRRRGRRGKLTAMTTTPSASPSPTCWVVTDGAAGAENQCLGLAEALATTPTVKRIRVRAPWR